MPGKMIAETDFDYVRDLVRQHSAIVLDDGKEYLVEARLMPLARHEGFLSIAALVSALQKGPFNGLHEKVIEAMTTNETSFFRDGRPFQAFKKHILPDLVANRADRRLIQIWCAASSSGQEPYSLAMLVDEFFSDKPGWSVRIIASDISNQILNRAREGRYSQLEINRGLPAQYLVRHFDKVGMEWQLKEHIRSMVDFKLINLAAEWPPLPIFDLIFMRNVLIYFDPEMKKTILARVRGLMRPQSYFVLGGAETTLNIDDHFQHHYLEEASCYRLQEA